MRLKYYYLTMLLLLLVSSCSIKPISFIDKVRGNVLKNEKKELKNQFLEYHYVYRGNIEYDYFIRIDDSGNVEITDKTKNMELKYYAELSSEELKQLVDNISLLKQSNLENFYSTDTLTQEHNILSITSTALFKNIDFTIKYYNFNPHKPVKKYINDLLKPLSSKEWGK